MMTPEPLRLQTPHINLAGLAWGPAEGLPVLALHGWLDNAASYTGLGPLLPNCRLVALDFPGHGRSAHRPPGAAYHFVDYVPDVVAVADVLGWDRFALLGHSLGGGVASLVAAVLPERITHLALIEALGPVSDKAEDTPTRLANSLSGWQQATRPAPVYPDIEHAAQMRHKATGLSMAASLLLAERSTRSVAEGISWRSDQRLTKRSPLYMTEEQVLACLKVIQAPTLLIRGANGFLWNRPYMSVRFETVKQLQIADLPGSHHLHLEEPGPTAEVLCGFLSAG